MGASRRLVSTLAALSFGAVFVAAPPASAAASTSETFSFADPFGGSFSCDGFDAVYSGNDHGTVTTWFDAAGDPIMQVGHITAVETDTNLTSQASVVVRTQLTVHVDYAAGVQTISGIRNLSTTPGSGVVIQSVGHLTVTTEGDFIDVRGPADDIFNDGGFCEALAG
ncbi:MAG: hypothetical protein JWM93_502 [Frankiales bacterium]|nr:hypothetical protein [Frankiales bacterium]